MATRPVTLARLIHTLQIGCDHCDRRFLTRRRLDRHWLKTHQWPPLPKQ